MSSNPKFIAPTILADKPAAVTGVRIIMKWPEVNRVTGRSRSSVERDMRSGNFPMPVQIGANAIGWYADEIAEWQASRPRVAYVSEAA